MPRYERCVSAFVILDIRSGNLRNTLLPAIATSTYNRFISYKIQEDVWYVFLITSTISNFQTFIFLFDCSSQRVIFQPKFTNIFSTVRLPTVEKSSVLVEDCSIFKQSRSLIVERSTVTHRECWESWMFRCEVLNVQKLRQNYRSAVLLRLMATWLLVPTLFELFQISTVVIRTVSVSECWHSDCSRWTDPSTRALKFFYSISDNQVVSSERVVRKKDDRFIRLQAKF